jgi:hypothetical protein
MTLFYGDCCDTNSFCYNYGCSFSTICDDPELIKAISMINNREYITRFVNHEDGSMYARKIFNDGFVWPKNFTKRIVTFSNKFVQKYGLEIINNENRLFIGNKMEIKKSISIRSNELDLYFKNERKTIDETLVTISKNVVSNGGYYLVL